MVSTDNKDYVIALTCWEDNEISYSVWTVEPWISDKNRKIVWKYLEGLGFNRNYLTETSYDNCPKISSSTAKAVSNKYVCILQIPIVLFISIRKSIQ